MSLRSVRGSPGPGGYVGRAPLGVPGTITAATRQTIDAIPPERQGSD
jgi:hypothetical protein